MHPNVYKKQHKTLQSILHLCLCIMILSRSVSSQSCNVAVNMIKIYSPYTKGYLRIEGNKVVANSCNENCGNLYKITIDKHYMLIYDIRNGKFICWNKAYTKLVARRNPTNLTHCKFEDKISLNHRSMYIRYTTNHQGKEKEIRFNRAGVFTTPRHIRNCVRKHNWPVNYYMNLNPSSNMTQKELRAYRKLSKFCADPDFLLDTRGCISGLAEFCSEMKIRKDNGHNITSELSYLCKKEWSKSY